MSWRSTGRTSPLGHHHGADGAVGGAQRRHQHLHVGSVTGVGEDGSLQGRSPLRCPARRLGCRRSATREASCRAAPSRSSLNRRKSTAGAALNNACFSERQTRGSVRADRARRGSVAIRERTRARSGIRAAVRFATIEDGRRDDRAMAAPRNDCARTLLWAQTTVTSSRPERRSAGASRSSLSPYSEPRRSQRASCCPLREAPGFVAL
jgi:hypothetical protein